MPETDLPTEVPKELVGACCGAAHQRTTAVLVERREVLHRSEIADYDQAARKWRTTTTHRLKEIKRLAPGATLPDLARVLTAMSLTADATVADISRVGVDFLRHLKPVPQLVPIVPHDQLKLSRRKGLMYVPEVDLLGAVAVVLKQDRIVFDVGDAGTLQQALFAYTPEKPGPDADVAVALAAAVWWGEVMMRSQVHQPPAPRLPLPAPRKMTFNDALAISRREGANRRARI